MSPYENRIERKANIFSDRGGKAKTIGRPDRMNHRAQVHVSRPIGIATSCGLHNAIKMIGTNLYTRGIKSNNSYSKNRYSNDRGSYSRGIFRDVVHQKQRFLQRT
ncbi:hypothetical protein ElyMa_003304300 [Elysia marginata]|uniref:Uncharacterized protein n=1 Tax=Elysia marginata TaxID=1093978 RepID=A0AAV4JCF2_9GAST|nr:hypothetical protein ElyMa_003304300 [Elysia marginata]